MSPALVIEQDIARMEGEEEGDGLEQWGPTLSAGVPQLSHTPPRVPLGSPSPS